MNHSFSQRYRILRKLGAGGMGEVHLAHDDQLDRQVALKLMPEELESNEELRRRFASEARAASALNNPHVCVIYDVGETDDARPYIAMEFVSGESLARMITDGPLELSRSIEIAAQVADALQCAHKRGIVHRDIKPANVILNERWQAKVLDFGLAKRLPIAEFDAEDETELQETRAGSVLGTPNYMSPEQARGLPVDDRSDIFSLGVLLYEMATGRTPFGGTSLGDTIGKILQSPPPPLARYVHDAPPEFERIVLKCLQKDPDRRYQSAKELRVDLLNLQRLVNESGEMLATAARSSGMSQDASNSPSLPSPEEISDSDIFISCSEIDNQPLSPAKQGWITQFQHNLKVRLEQLSGEHVRVSTLPMPLGKIPSDGEALMRTIPNVKRMVSVVSPPFVRSEGCWRGVEHFWDASSKLNFSSAEEKPRLFKVVKTPVELNGLPSRVQDLLQRLIAYEFYERDPDSGRVREFDETFGEAARQRYYERIYDLAYEIAESFKLERPSNRHNGNGPSLAARQASVTPRRIYLAETTSDLQPARDRIRRELLDQGHTVWPEHPLPLIAGELERAISDYLQRCELAIHLVGDRYGLVPEDSEVSLAVLQNRLAAEQSKTAGLSRLVWMPRQLQPRDDRQAAFLRELFESSEAQCGADVIADTLENLKEVLNHRLSPANTPRVAAVSSAPRLYLICDSRDETAVERLEDFFYEQGIEVCLPELDGDESTTGEVHLRNLQDCDGAIVYYGDVGKAWVDIKLRELLKATGYRDGRRIELQAVYVTPPVDRRKERFKTLSAEIMRQEGAPLDLSALQAFASRLKTLHQEQSQASRENQ